MAEQTCRTCAYHDGFSWVCFNGESEHRADFTLDEQTCPYWQKHRTAERQNRTESKQKEQKEQKAESPLTADGSTADGSTAAR